MAINTTEYEHIVLGEDGVALVEGSNVPVMDIVIEHKKGWGVSFIHSSHPGLTLAEVYMALAYYADHKEEFDYEIECRERQVEQAWEESGLRHDLLNNIVTMEELERELDGQWVVLEEPVTDEGLQIKAGRLFWHTPNRKQLDRKLAESQSKSIAVWYIGHPPDDVIYVL